MTEGSLRHWPRFVVLLAALTLLLLMAPLAGSASTWISSRVAALAMGLAFVAMLLAAVYAVSGNRRAVIVGMSLMAPVLLSKLVDLIWHGRETAITNHVLSTAFLSYVIVMILRWMFRSQRVTFNLICAALCVYLLLGINWAIAYSMMQTLEPASFAFPSQAAAASPDSLEFGGETTVTSLYYSFVTITTLGYGDIRPVTPMARMLSVVEALTGQLFLAVLVARLVGLQTAQELE